MEYNLKQNDEIKKIIATLNANNALSVTMDGKDIQAVVTRVSDYHIHLNLDDGKGSNSVNVYVADDNGDKLIMINGIPYHIEDADNQPSKRSKKRMGRNLPDIVTPPMPAIVVNVLAKVGDIVKKNQKLVVLSAMKMETTLTAPFDGTVIKVNAKEGDKVSPGDILVDINKES